MNNDLIYKVNDKPPFLKVLLFAMQQVLAILAATITVPKLIGISQSAALFGAGLGTLVYLLFTKFNSPVFLGSSFAYIPPMIAAFSGALGLGYTAEVGYLGLVLGSIIAGLVYVIIGVLVKAFGTGWINKIMPKIIIGPVVSIIGLTLSVNAVSDLWIGGLDNSNAWLCLICGLVTMFTTMIISVYGKKITKMIPFIIGIGSGYLLAVIFTNFGKILDNDNLKIINFALFKDIKWLPDFSFIHAFGSVTEFNSFVEFLKFFLIIFFGYAPIAFVSFAEHIADHKNLSSIIGQDLLENPGLHRTLMGDGVGSMVGAFFGGCPNTTYGESIGCVAISKNASVITTLVTAILAIIISFIGPFITFLATIPNCVMGGVCITLYGFISVSGLKMIQDVDLNDNRNLFVVSVILITGVGGLSLKFLNNSGEILFELSAIVTALILGILVNIAVNFKRNKQ